MKTPMHAVTPVANVANVALAASAAKPGLPVQSHMRAGKASNALQENLSKSSHQTA